MAAHKFTYLSVTVEMAGEQIHLEASGEVDTGGKVFIDELYHKPLGSVYSKNMHDLLEIQPVFESICNQIKGRK